MAGEVTRVRVRPAIRRLAMWVGPVLLLIAAWQIWDAIEARRLEHALLRVREAQSAAEPELPRGSENAARYYAAAAILATPGSGQTTVQVAPGGPILDVAGAMRDALSRGVPPPGHVLDALSGQVERRQEVLELLARASALDVVRSFPDAQFPTIGMQYVNRLAGLETLHLLVHGQGDSAAKLLFDRTKSLRAFDREYWFEASMKAYFVREIATDVGTLVARATPSAGHLEDLDRAIAGVYKPDELERLIQGQTRSRFRLRSVWELEQRRFVGPLGPIYRHHLEAELRATQDGIQAARLPWPDRIHAMNKIPERRSILPEVPRFIGAWRAVEGFRDQTVMLGEALAAVRCARLVIAIELFRRQHRRLPDSLDELTPPEGDEGLVDPFTGKSLHYARANDGYVVYSAGRDFRDDGGKLSSDLPRWQPAARYQPDVGVRVPLSLQP